MKRIMILTLLLTLFGVSSAGLSQGASEALHTVRYGETLGLIASRYGMTLATLKSLNGLVSSRIYPGDVLRLTEADARPPAASPLTHTVRRGETLGIIAAFYSVNLPELIALNGLFGHIIYPGQQLLLPAAGPAPANTAPAARTEAPESRPNDANKISYVVRPGDTLGEIARHFGITLNALMQANDILYPHRIDVTQTLRIPRPAARPDRPPAPQPAEPGLSSPSTPGDRQQYIVQPGDYLSLIGKKLATSWVAMAELNGIANPDKLDAGMVLLVPNSDDLIKYGATYAHTSFNLYENHPGPHIGRGREFVVVLSTQSAYAYEDGVLMKAALVSTGLPATPTVQGDFAIYRKTRRQRMTGPDYDLDNVEWVMYFYQGYAFHGTWWHSNFGQRMSHGCVNMTNADAKWFYDFASIGTPVHVRYY